MLLSRRSVLLASRRIGQGRLHGPANATSAGMSHRDTDGRATEHPLSQEAHPPAPIPPPRRSLPTSGVLRSPPRDSRGVQTPLHWSATFTGRSSCSARPASPRWVPPAPPARRSDGFLVRQIPRAAGRTAIAPLPGRPSLRRVARPRANSVQLRITKRISPSRARRGARRPLP